MENKYSVILFKSVSHALSAEKKLLGSGIPFKLIPVPREISSDCGVCIRFHSSDEKAILDLIGSREDIDRIVAL